MSKAADNKESLELRTAAILVWRYLHLEERGTASAVEAIKAREKERIECFQESLQMILKGAGEIHYRINGGCVEAEADGLRFVALELPSQNNQEELTLVTLLGRCQRCGVETMSEPFYNLAGLGKMLEKFEPIHWHYCYGVGR